ncbi:hypothetical protein ACFQ73_09570 [Amycolatopsis japonica]|uniref:hypothetical protein n=1 Tax=Amycolatopsis japonica TaxID=208439 RepID=UPI00366DD495
MPDPFEKIVALPNNDDHDRYLELYSAWEDISDDWGYVNQYGGWPLVRDHQRWGTALRARKPGPSEKYEGLPKGWHPLLRLDYSYKDHAGVVHDWGWPQDRRSFDVLTGPGPGTGDAVLILS